MHPQAREIDAWTEDALLVGHLPFLGKLMSRLVAHDEGVQVAALRPGTAVCLEKTDDAGWTVAWMIRPDLLPR